jgi:pilus assembly protein CpaB
MRLVLVILVALAVAGGAGFYVLQGLGPRDSGAAPRVEAPTMKEVFVPARELAAGTIIGVDDLLRMELTASAITSQMVVADAAGEGFLIGSVSRQTLPQGVPVARSAVVQPGERGFLAAVLPRGQRAVTIPISEVAGLNGLAMPGDRVDILLTYTVSGGASDAIRASETVLKNVRVLALDQRLGAVPIDPEKPGKKAEPTPVAKTATLEVTPREAEIVALAVDMGTLSLALNSVRDGGDEVQATRPLSSGAPGFDLAAEATAPRRLTRESDVTSTTKIQVVRGRKLSGNLTPSGASAASTPAGPAAP